MKILLASRNPKKLIELRRILAPALPDVEVVGLDDVEPYDEVPESGATFADNALIIVNKKTGFVVPPGAHEAAAAYAARILLNPALQNEMSAAARAHACENFSLRSAAGKLERIYTRCLENKRGGNGSKH